VVFAYIPLFLLPLFLKARSRTPDEVPTGFYNFFEMLIEGAYDFLKGIVDEKARDFFPYFMTILLLVLLANWTALLPGYDAIGIWEYKPEFKMHQAVDEIISEAKAELSTLQDEAESEGVALSQKVEEALEEEAFAETVEAEAGEEDLLHLLEKDAFAAELPAEEVDALLAEYGPDVSLEEVEHAYEEYKIASVDKDNIGDLRVGPWLLRAGNAEEGNEPEVINEEGWLAGAAPEAADWTIVPFVRPAATDLNFNLALAIVAMVMVQYFGFKYLGGGYLKKFFVWPRGFVDTFVKDPMQGIILLIEPIVGLIELVSEFSKIISFAFRLLGNIFGGMVVLFVISSIAAIANVGFFGLELFIGAIQAFVFALLTVIFMSSATESHDHGDEHH
jgi:F0F1-type ATP synthase membrane subunit a